MLRSSRAELGGGVALLLRSKQHSPVYLFEADMQVAGTILDVEIGQQNKQDHTDFALMSSMTVRQSNLDMQDVVVCVFPAGDDEECSEHMETLLKHALGQKHTSIANMRKNVSFAAAVINALRVKDDVFVLFLQRLLNQLQVLTKYGWELPKSSDMTSMLCMATAMLGACIKSGSLLSS